MLPCSPAKWGRVLHLLASCEHASTHRTAPNWCYLPSRGENQPSSAATVLAAPKLAAIDITLNPQTAMPVGTASGTLLHDMECSHAPQPFVQLGDAAQLLQRAQDGGQALPAALAARDA